jgi:hypothetical protein
MIGKLLAILVVTISPSWAKVTYLGKHPPAPEPLTSFKIAMNQNGGIVAGNTVVIFTTNRNSSGRASGSNSFVVSDTDGNTFWPVNTDICYIQGGVANWPCVFETNGDRGNVAWIVPSAKFTDATDVVTVSWTTGATYAGGWAIMASDTQATDPWDGSANAAFSSATSPQSSGAASGHSTNTNDIVLTFCASSLAVSPESGFTSVEGGTAGYLVETKIGAGNDSGSCSWSGTNFSVAIETITLRPSGTYSGIYRRQVTRSGGTNGIQCKVGITGTPGGTLLVLAGTSAGDDTLSLTDSGSHRWSTTLLRNGTNCYTAGAGAACIAGYLPNAPANMTWVEVGATGGDNGSCEFVEYAGIQASSPLDQSTPGASSSGGSWSSGAITTTRAAEVLVGYFFGNAVPGPMTPETSEGWTFITSGNYFTAGSGLGEQIVSSKQTKVAFTGTMTCTGACYSESAIATFIGATQP